MFAKLVTATAATVSANVFYNTLIRVITGSLTSNTQLDPTTFNQSLSYVISAVPTNWTVNDPSANLAGMVSPLPGANMQVLFSPASDDPTRGKYLLLSPLSSVNTSFYIAAIPTEGYANTTKVYSNTYGNPYITANVFAPIATTISPTLTSNLEATQTRWATDLVSYMSTQYTTNGAVVIVSASNTHLFVASYKNNAGTLQGGTASAFNNYFYVSEYSRDDPWNTVGNGYPSWFFEGSSNNFGAYANALSSTANVHYGAICRVLNTASGNDLRWLDMNTGGSTQNTCDWGIATRNIPYGSAYIFPNGASALTAVSRGQIIPRGLAAAATYVNYIGNYAIARDASKNIASAVSELRLLGVCSGNVVTTYAGFSLCANSMFAGGSISNVSPYIYAFRSGYNTFDEVSFNGNTYMNLIVNAGLPGTSNASNMLVREV